MSDWPASLPEIVWFDRVGSTNDEARARWSAGQTGPVWIAAGEQTHGKGRQGRHWDSRQGNLYASLLWPATTELKRLAGLSLVAGLAVRDAISSTDVSGAVQLKWPNDVLVDGRKVSGVLIETVSDAGSHAAVIGCGLNLAHHPSQTRWPATDLAACGALIRPQDMMCRLGSALHKRLAQWSDGSGLDSIRQDWMNAALGRGQLVTVEGGKTGVFTGLSEDGALLLTLPDGSSLVHLAGDVEWIGQKHPPTAG